MTLLNQKIIFSCKGYYLRTLTLLFFLCFFAKAGSSQIITEEAQSLIDASQYQSARTLLEDFIDRKSRDDFDVAQAAYQLSYVYLQLQNFKKANDYNERSLKIKQRLHYEYVADNHMRKGTIALRQRQFENALDHYLYALELPHEDIAFSGVLYSYLGLTCARMNRFAKAKEFYQKSQETFQTAYNVGHPDIVSNYLQIGKVELATGDFLAAKESFNKALYIDERIDTLNQNPRRIAIHNAQGALNFYYLKKDTIALQHYKKARDVSQKLWGGSHPESIRCLSNMVEVFLYRDEYKQARHTLHAALDRLAPNWNTTNAVGEMNEVRSGDQILLSHLYSLNAKISMAWYDQEKTDNHLLSAYTASEKAASVFEHWLNRIQGESTQAVLLQQNVDVYESGIQAAYQLSFSTGDNIWIEKAFVLVERSKASILKRMMHRLDAYDQMPEGEAMLTQDKSLQATIASYEVQLENDYDNAELRQDLLDAKRKYTQFVRSIEKKYPEYFNERFGKIQPDIAAIQNDLDNQTAMLSYYIGEELYYIFGLTNNSMSAFAFPQDSILPGYDKKKKVKAVRFAKEQLKIFEKIGGEVYSELSNDIAPVSLKEGIGAQLAAIKRMQKEEFAHFSNRLYGKLVYPMKDFIKRKKHLIIIPHGELYYLPFEAMTSTKAVGAVKYSKLDYLVRDYAMTYHYSADLFHQSKKKRENQEIMENNFLGIAPVFSNEKTAGYVWNSRDYVLEDSFSNREKSLRSSAMFGDGLRALLNSEEEILSIAKRFAKKKLYSKALLHQEATEEAFKRELPAYRFVHVATHSFADPKNPRLSGVLFANYVGNQDEEDGILHAPETFMLNVKADLLVLSSCESGTGKYVDGEGLMSLTRGFMYSGANNMLCSMWKVYDSYTKTLMVRFYDYMLNGDSYSNALRRAKLKMIKKEKTAHPRKWSGFILIGVE